MLFACSAVAVRRSVAALAGRPCSEGEGRRAVLRHRPSVTLDRTIAAIARRSEGVWIVESEGLALVPTPRGYALTARPEIFETATLPGRVSLACEDGTPMRDGHILTQRERERAVRAILSDVVP